MTIETSWLGRENRFSRQIHRLTASLLVLGAAACGAPVAQEPGAPMAYIEPPPIVASIDRDAFARFAQGLESGSGVEPADIRVNLPILGLSVPRSGLESAPEMTRPQQDYAADQTGYWYAQVTETPFGHLVTRGSLLRRADTVPLSAPVPTIEAPSVILGGDDARDEAHGEFVLGGVSYSVSLYCAPESVEVCSDGESVREVVANLSLIEQGSAP